MIDKIRSVFDGELNVENIRQIATYEYEIDTFGYNYYYSAWKIPTGTFALMNDYGLHNIRIMKSEKINGYTGEYLTTIRFTVKVEELEDRLQRDKEWQERWREFNKRRT